MMDLEEMYALLSSSMCAEGLGSSVGGISRCGDGRGVRANDSSGFSSERQGWGMWRGVVVLSRLWNSIAWVACCSAACRFDLSSGSEVHHSVGWSLNDIPAFE